MVTLEIYSKGKAFGLTLNKLTEPDVGTGYRVFGPKLLGDSQPITQEEMSVDAIDRLIAELELAREFLS